MAAIAQTIAIVDKSGKIVSTSRQLKDVFREAKLAYQERKAEIAAQRKAREDRELHKAIKAMSIADEQERSHGRRHRQGDYDSRYSGHRDRPTTERHQPNRSLRDERSGMISPRSPNDHPPHASPAVRGIPPPDTQRPQVKPEYGYYSPSGVATPNTPRPQQSPRNSNELVRRKTDLGFEHVPSKPPRPGHLPRTHTEPTLNYHSDDGIDLDLAYGEFHPDSISPTNKSLPNVSRSLTIPDEQHHDREELSSLVLKCKLLIDEANCAQHSVKAVMAHLQKNPDAMAAVALTLAEISNLASKVAPGALTALKAGAPTVFGLLAAPEFLVAVGVGVGLTVVMFGGYKIVKKIVAKHKNVSGENLLEMPPDRVRQPSMDEMINVEELSRIEHWRRGIADSQFEEMTRSETRSEVSSASQATSVEGEYITPAAAKSLGHLPMPKRQQSKDDSGRSRKEGGERRRRRRHGNATESGYPASKSSSSKVGEESRKDRALVKVKKPSPLRRMFRGESG